MIFQATLQRTQEEKLLQSASEPAQLARIPGDCLLYTPTPPLLTLATSAARRQRPQLPGQVRPRPRVAAVHEARLALTHPHTRQPGQPRLGQEAEVLCLLCTV